MTDHPQARVSPKIRNFLSSSNDEKSDEIVEVMLGVRQIYSRVKPLRPFSGMGRSSLPVRENEEILLPTGSLEETSAVKDFISSVSEHEVSFLPLANAFVVKVNKGQLEKLILSGKFDRVESNRVCTLKEKNEPSEMSSMTLSKQTKNFMPIFD